MSVFVTGRLNTAEALAVRERGRDEERVRKGGQVAPLSFPACGAVEFGGTVALRSGAGGALLCNDLWTAVSFGQFKVGAEVPACAPAPARRAGALAGATAPAARQTFVVSKIAGRSAAAAPGPVRAFDREADKVLHYCEPFQLQCHPALLVDEKHGMMGAPYYLHADRSLAGQTVSMHKDGKDPKTHWVAVPASLAASQDPYARELAQARGKAIPAGASVCLRHVMSGLPLAAVLPAQQKQRLSTSSSSSSNSKNNNNNNNNPAAAAWSAAAPEADPARAGSTDAFGLSGGTMMAVECVAVQAARALPGETLTWTLECARSAEEARDTRQLPKRLTSAVELLGKIREILCEREGGERFHGIRSIALEFKIMDTDKTGRLDREEILSGLAKFGVSLDEEQAQAVLDFCDSDHDGSVDLNEFLAALRGPLSKRRLKLIMMAFAVLDKDASGEVTLAELGSIYDTSCHPDVVDGRKTKEQVLKEFAAQWDKGGADSKGKGDGVITKDEFVHYYRDVSASIDDDDYFELMIRNAWHISGGEGWCANTSNIRCLVTHSDDSCEVVELKDDFGVSRHDMPMIRTLLRKQGVQDIKRVSLSD
jgi:Ca2+-binding EF-hand superfamily protein